MAHVGGARLQGKRRIEGQTEEQQEREQVAADGCHANQGPRGVALTKCELSAFGLALCAQVRNTLRCLAFEREPRGTPLGCISLGAVFQMRMRFTTIIFAVCLQVGPSTGRNGAPARHCLAESSMTQWTKEKE